MVNTQQRINAVANNLIGQHRDISVYNFLSFINIAEIVFKYMEQKFDKNMGLDRTKMQILDLLAVEGGSSTPSKLSWGVNRSKITITTALNNLEKQGLVISSRIEKDHRVRLVTITEKGLDILDRFLPLRREIFAQAMRCFNQGEAEIFQSMINRFRENIFSLSDDSDLDDILHHFRYSFINQVTGDNSPRMDKIEES